MSIAEPMSFVPPSADRSPDEVRAENEWKYSELVLPKRLPRTPSEILAQTVMQSVNRSTPGGLRNRRPRKHGWHVVWSLVLLAGGLLVLSYLAMRM